MISQISGRDNIDSLATALADLVNGAEDGRGDSPGGNFQVKVPSINRLLHK